MPEQFVMSRADILDLDSQHCYYYKSKGRILLELGVVFDLLDTAVGICHMTAGVEVCRVRKNLRHWLFTAPV